MTFPTSCFNSDLRGSFFSLLRGIQHWKKIPPVQRIRGTQRIRVRLNNANTHYLRMFVLHEVSVLTPSCPLNYRESKFQHTFPIPIHSLTYLLHILFLSLFHGKRTLPPPLTLLPSRQDYESLPYREEVHSPERLRGIFITREHASKVRF